MLARAQEIDPAVWRDRNVVTSVWMVLVRAKLVKYAGQCSAWPHQFGRAASAGRGRSAAGSCGSWRARARGIDLVLLGRPCADQMGEKADLMAGIIQFISADSLIELLLFLQHGTLSRSCY